MKPLTSILLGSSNECTFEQRLYRGLCITCSVGNLGMTISNILNHLLPDLLISLSGVVFSGILYYFARYRKKYFNLGFYFFFTFLIAISLFNDFSIHRSTPFICLVAMVIMLAYSPVKWHFKITTYILSVTIIIILLENWLPNLVIHSYMTQKASNINLLAGIITTIIFCYVCIYMLRKSYEDEREKNLLQQVKMEKANYQKSMFFINLSHEIKTPLTLIENYLEKYIELKGEDEELMVMRQNIKKMRRDILDYLNVEHLEKGNLSYEKLETILLSKFLNEKISFFTPYAESKGVMVNCFIEPDVFTNTNLKGVDHVLNNLLENAVKYTPEHGKIKICLKQEDKTARLTIQNSSSIIPNDQLPHLFEPFYQLSNEKSNTQGIGMGLYIVKKILDSSGGQIFVKSSKEEGVTFSVMLPLSKERENIVKPEHNIPVMNINTKTPRAMDSSYLTNRKSLLLVEDHEDLLRYLAGELSEDYNVFVARNGSTASEKLKNIPTPDLIVSDIMMDQMDGYEFLTKTITNGRFAHIPFIFLTAKDNPDEKIAGLDMGALDFITKPFSITELKMKIRTIIEQKTRISEAAIHKMKKQYTDDHFLKIRENHDEILNINVLRYNLTAREKEVIILIQQGLKYEEIGKKLFISEHTVIRHVQNIYKKTDSSTKIDLLQKMFSSQPLVLT